MPNSVILKVYNADNQIVAYLNGKEVYNKSTEGNPALNDSVELASQLIGGANTLLVVGTNWSAGAAFKGELSVDGSVTPWDVVIPADKALRGVVWSQTFVINKAAGFSGKYLIRSKLNGFVLDIKGGSTAPVTQIISYPVNGAKGTANQHWSIVPTPDGSYLIQSELNNFVLDITGSNTAPVTPVISYPVNNGTGTPNQHWELVPVAGATNTFLIRTKLNGFVLDIEGGNTAPSARIISYPVNNGTGTANQHWELVPVSA